MAVADDSRGGDFSAQAVARLRQGSFRSRRSRMIQPLGSETLDTSHQTC